MIFINGRALKWGIFSLMLLLAGMIPLSGSAAPRQTAHLVLLDPAHGGDDLGVVSDKLREKDLTLNLALLIRQEAQRIPELRIELTRSEDRKLTTAERIKEAGRAKAEAVVSLHVNSGFGKKATGYEIYFPGFGQAPPGEGSTSPILQDMARNKTLNESVRLAQQIQSGLEKVFPFKGRGLRDAPSPLLNGLAVPGLVVEIGFASQSDDRKKLTDPGTQKAIAAAVVKGLQYYFASQP